MSENDKKRHSMEEQIRQTLSSLDNIEDIDAKPYFYARLKARIDANEKTDAPGVVRFLLGGRLAPSLLAIVLLLNVLTVAVVLRDGDESQTSLQQEYVETVANEYLGTGSSGWLEIESEQVLP